MSLQRKSSRAVFLSGGLILVSMALAFATVNIGSGQHELVIDTGQPWLPTMDDLVWHSEAVVVARYITATDVGTIVVSTAVPAVGGTPVGPPEDSFPGVVVTYIVDDVLKGGDVVTVSQVVTELLFGFVPSSQAEATEDARSTYPLMWPGDTEFLLFLESEGGIISPSFVVPFFECGRLLTSGDTSCSDGSRTVVDWMSGMDREDLLSAAATAIADPGPTSTLAVWPTPEHTPTP